MRTLPPLSEYLDQVEVLYGKLVRDECERRIAKLPEGESFNRHRLAWQTNQDCYKEVFSTPDSISNSNLSYD